ncbi:MAG: glycosyltransferase family 39 protein [Flavobacteriales bacterium]|nr:glycosyltransferase family 39 protein [Flavobacteriales bacterium]MBK8533214.1 glycosyltransferase family 39 protein [Flavobacteriales bacterium]MBK9626296.1 glycosyltransferase family 39 protein [Flavobacteriales bacterium]
MPSRGRLQLIFLAVGVLFFLPGLGAVHLFDWDEINFAEIAREMVITGNWGQPQIDFLPFHEKPPLFMWMQALSMTMFGVGEFAARLPNALCGILTLWVLYRIGDQLRGKVFGMLWALAYFGSILPHLYFRSGIIDPWFNLFIFLGLHALVTLVQCDPHRPSGTLNARSDGRAALVGLFLGLAVLTKGPVGVLIPVLVLTTYWAMGRFQPVLKWRRIAIIAFATLLTAGSWALVDLLRHGPDFIVGFFWRQVAMLSSEDAGHGGFFGYHFVVLLIGCFPASVFALQELLRPTREDTSDQNDHRRWMVILFWVVLLLFSVVKTKIVHYSSLCYFPLTYLAAVRLEHIWKKQEGYGWTRFLLGVLGTVIALLFIVVPFVGINIDVIKPLFAKDPFALANLDADVHWSGIEAMAGVLLLAALAVAHWLHGRAQFRQSIVAIFGGTALFITTALYFFINRIEGYSQRAAIEFFEEQQGETCYVITKNYKSYAQLFYTRKEPVTDPRAHDEEWLLYGDIGRPVYVVCKITSADDVGSIRTLTEIQRKNGFVFFKRDP